MQRLMIIAVGGLLCFGCGSDKDDKKPAKDPAASNTKDDKQPDKTKTAVVTGCQSDKDCKGYRVCDNGKCAEPKKAAKDPATSLPTPTPTPTPTPGTTNTANACKGFVDAICDSCGASSTMCSMLKTMMGATKGMPAAMLTQLCSRSAPQIAQLKAIPVDQRKMACTMMETMFKKQMGARGGGGGGAPTPTPPK